MHLTRNLIRNDTHNPSITIATSNPEGCQLNRDNQLVSIIQTGDPASAHVASAWTELVEKYDAVLLNHCTRFWHGNSTEAEHSAQNSWIKVFNSLHGYRVGTEEDEGNFYG